MKKHSYYLAERVSKRQIGPFEIGLAKLYLEMYEDFKENLSLIKALANWNLERLPSEPSDWESLDILSKGDK